MSLPNVCTRPSDINPDEQIEYCRFAWSDTRRVHCHYYSVSGRPEALIRPWRRENTWADGTPLPDAEPCPCWAASLPEVFRA